MKDHLMDLISHTYDLGFITCVKITGTDKETRIDSIAEDKSVILSATLASPMAEFIGLFGMPNLDKLKILLNLQEYRENADINIVKQDRNGIDTPVGLHFTNATKDFQNNYRFMSAEIISETIKTAKFKGANWAVTITPAVSAIQRLKMQAQANSDIPVFQTRTRNKNLVISFGDHSTHTGEFVFEQGVGGALNNAWKWPVKQIISILDLVGDKTLRICDDGIMEIVVDSGLAVYSYSLPAHSK